MPKSAELKVQGYSQITMSCGETAAATILKAAGEPISLGQVDTQIVGGGGNLLMDAEIRRRGLTMINGPGDMTKLKALVASGYPVMVSVGNQDGGGGHYATVTGYDEATKTLTIQNGRAAPSRRSPTTSSRAAGACTRTT